MEGESQEEHDAPEGGVLEDAVGDVRVLLGVVAVIRVVDLAGGRIKVIKLSRRRYDKNVSLFGSQNAFCQEVQFKKT